MLGLEHLLSREHFHLNQLESYMILQLDELVLQLSILARFLVQFLDQVGYLVLV